MSMEEFKKLPKRHPRNLDRLFGKGGELYIISKLFRKGFDVYLTLVDDKGIDCVVRLSESRYLDIQIKSASKRSMQPNNFGAISVKNPRGNYFFIFYLEGDDQYWVIPSMDFERLWNKTTKEGSKHKGKFNVVIPYSTTSKKYGLFKNYEGEKGLSLLKQ